MELRGFFRKRPVAGVPEADRAPEPGTGDAPAPGPASPRPGADWDGGWRRVAPPTVTVARSSIGVSDGLRFRSRLASWQNVAYSDGELGHAVLPSAPVGRIHGVARTPGTPRSGPSGAPLVLRAADAPPAPSAPADGEAPAGRGATAPRRVVPAVAGSASRPSGDGATPAPPQAAPAPVRARRTAPPLTVARRPATPPRTLSAVASTAVPAPSATPPVRRGLGDPLGTLPPGAGPATRRRADEPPSDGGPELPVVQRRADPPAAPAVRPGLGESLGELPSGAARPTLAAPESPVVQRRADAPAVPAVRPGLGESLGELPSVDGPSGPPAGPALPVVQRQADASAASEQPASGVPALPVVQRQVDAPASTGPAAGSSVRPTLDGQPPVAAPGGPALPALQRRADVSAASEQPA
ncbi:hypothetical protein ABZ565_09995, partial [Streptomyces sp. NPDC016469]